MRLRQIEVFHAVYSTGSVTRAAEMLSVSQPSVSKVLAHAEQQLGYALFDRVRGKLIPTPEADQLFSHVIKVNDSVDRLRNLAENLRTAEQGSVRIASTPAFGIDLLPRAIASYRELHPDTVFLVETLHHDEIAAALLDSRIDVGLAFDPEYIPGIAKEKLTRSSFVVLAPPDIDFEGQQSVSICDLDGMNFIKLDNRGPLGRLLANHIESSGVQLNNVAYAETYQVAKALVSYGVGVTIIDQVTARSSGHGSVRAWPLEPELRFTISALHQDKAPLSIVSQRFIDHLKISLEEFLRF
ncbi:LysR family transcriptional regulator [Pseudomonadota bacterium]